MVIDTKYTCFGAETIDSLCHCEGLQARGNLPVKCSVYFSTQSYATLYQEIPTSLCSSE